MKTKISLGLLMLLTLGLSAFAQDIKTEKFRVSGNCDMCKARIEKAAKSVEGVKSATWDKETKMAEVTFDSKKTDIHKVHMAIARAGHDTDMHKASDETYDKLPGCCKYEREVKKEADDHAGHMEHM